MGIDMSSRRASRSDAVYRKGEASIREGAEETYDEKRISEILMKRFHAPNYQPPVLPVVATKLLALANDPNVEITKVVKLLESDGMLASQVLKTACSPMYRGTSEVVSIRQAIMRLGMKTVRDIVVQASLALKVFRCDAYGDAMNQVRRHCVATGTVARRLSHHTSWHNDYAFLVGILHDIGIAAALLVLAEHSRMRKLELDALWPSIDGTHEEAAKILAKLWNLPPEVGLVIANHHFPVVAGRPHPMIATLIVADEIAKDMGFPPVAVGEEDAALALVRPVDQNTPEAVAKAYETLALPDQIVEMVKMECEPLLGEI